MRTNQNRTLFGNFLLNEVQHFNARVKLEIHLGLLSLRVDLFHSLFPTLDLSFRKALRLASRQSAQGLRGFIHPHPPPAT